MDNSDTRFKFRVNKTQRKENSVNKIKPLLLIVVFFVMLSGNAIAHVILDYPVAGETFQVGDVVIIQWHVAIYHGPANWDLYFSKDGGSTWESIAMDLPESKLTYNWTIPNIETDSGQVKVVQDNVTGADYTDASGNFVINTSTGINPSADHADNFVLYPAYPNPFNNSTNISFYLPTTARVQINIYNLLAQKLATLVNKEMFAGIHQVEWNAGTSASGVYIYQISTPYGLETRKIILMK
jgi:hypothetical protein